MNQVELIIWIIVRMFPFICCPLLDIVGYRRGVESNLSSSIITIKISHFIHSNKCSLLLSIPKKTEMFFKSFYYSFGV